MDNNRRIIANLIHTFGDDGKISAKKLSFLCYLYDWAHTLRFNSQSLNCQWSTDGYTPNSDLLDGLCVYPEFRCFNRTRLGSTTLTDVAILNNPAHSELTVDEHKIVSTLQAEFNDASYDTLLVSVHHTHPIYTLSHKEEAINLENDALRVREALKATLFNLVKGMPISDAVARVCDDQQWTTDIALLQEHLVNLCHACSIKESLRSVGTKSKPANSPIY